MENNRNFNLKKIAKFARKHKKISIFSVLLVFILILVLMNAFLSKEPEPVFVVKSSLKGFADIEQLSVLEYPYNSFTTVFENTKNGKINISKPKYHVAYDGMVKLGFDFDDVKITENAEKKVIYIDIPEITINSVSIDNKSLQFIFIKDKYETSDVVPEALAVCQKDLESKANGEQGASLRTLAKENAISTIKAITEPLIKNLPEGYTIEYR